MFLNTTFFLTACEEEEEERDGRGVCVFSFPVVLYRFFCAMNHEAFEEMMKAIEEREAQEKRDEALRCWELRRKLEEKEKREEGQRLRREEVGDLTGLKRRLLQEFEKAVMQ